MDKKVIIKLALKSKNDSFQRKVLAFVSKRRTASAPPPFLVEIVQKKTRGPAAIQRPGVGAPMMAHRALLEFALKRREPELGRVVLAYCQRLNKKRGSSSNIILEHALTKKDVELAHLLLTRIS